MSYNPSRIVRKVVVAWGIVAVFVLYAKVAFGQGLSALYPWPEGPNLLQNPSFEEKDASGKPVAWGFNARVNANSTNPLCQPPPVVWSLTTETASHGTHAVKIYNANCSTTSPSTTQTVTGTKEGYYTFRLRAKTEAMGVAKPDGFIRGVVVAGDGGQPGKTDGLSKTNDWKLLDRRSFFAAQGVKQVRLDNWGKPDGTGYYDEVGLHYQIPPLAHGVLLKPNYRGYIWSDGDQMVKMWVRLNPDDHNVNITNITVTLALETESGQPINAVTVTPSTLDFDVSLSASKAPYTPLKLRLLTKDAAGKVIAEYPPYLLRKITPEERATFQYYIDDQGRWVRWGVPTFPIGIYNTSGFSQQAKYYEPLFDKWKDAGINWYINYWWTKNAVAPLNVAMNVGVSRGISYFHTVNDHFADHKNFPSLSPCMGKAPTDFLSDQDYIACRAWEIGPHKGLAGWYTADERPAEVTERVFRQYQTIRQHDTDGMTLIINTAPGEVHRWTHISDIFGLDPYPIWEKEGDMSPLHRVSMWTKVAQEMTKGTGPVWMVLQYWDASKVARFPNYHDLRSMTWLALTAGAKGIGYWSYGALGWQYLPDEQKPAYWEYLKRVTLEVKSLEPALLAKDAKILASKPTADILSLERVAEGKKYLLTANNTPTTQTVEFHLQCLASQVSVLGENRTIPVVDGKFTDAYEPYGVHLYTIE